MNETLEEIAPKQMSMDDAIMTYLGQSDYAAAGSLYMQCYAYAVQQGQSSDVCLQNALWCLRHAVVQLGQCTEQDQMVAHASRCVELAKSIQTVEVPSESVA